MSKYKFTKELTEKEFDLVGVLSYELRICQLQLNNDLGFTPPPERIKYYEKRVQKIKDNLWNLGIRILK